MTLAVVLGIVIALGLLLRYIIKTAKDNLAAEINRETQTDADNLAAAAKQARESGGIDPDAWH